MPLVCPTNLSAHSLRAATLATALASRLDELLWLVGVPDGGHLLHEEDGDSPREARRRLEAEAERLRRLGAAVRTRLGPGGLEEALDADEALRHPRLVVVAREGWAPPSALRRASPAERLARHLDAPVLAVRRADALLDWARGRRRLLVLAGVDLEPGSDAVVGFLEELRRVGPCTVLATYVCSPAEERSRLGLHTPVHVERLDPVVRGMEVLDEPLRRVLSREVRARVGPLPGEGEVEVVLESGYGRRADHLLHVAHEREVDLVVVGTHQRRGVRRLWHGSVSEGVLRHAEGPVACVPPARAGARASGPLPGPVRAVLVPVDFSEASARAVAQARALVGPGGRVHLLHVHRRRPTETRWDWYGVLPEPPESRDEVLRRLRALVPREAGAVHWTLEGVSGDDVARAICQATEREGVDLVCLGASGEGRGPDAVDSAVARALVARCRRPVMVLPPH